MSTPHESSVTLLRYNGGIPRSAPDLLAQEEPLEIRVRGQGIAVTMRTPGDDPELACGFLISENIIARREDVIDLAHCQTGPGARAHNVLNVFLAPSVQVDFDQLTRHTFAASSCGLCGKAAIESIHQHFPPVDSEVQVDEAVLRELPAKLLDAQESFARTGGLHAAGLFTAQGDLLAVREDVGRHNAVDKAIGWAFLNGRTPLAEHILVVSGRASFEIMQKALSARIPIVAAVSAPSSLAVEFARESGQTLIGFLRAPSFNLYTHPHRVASRKGALQSV